MSFIVATLSGDHGCHDGSGCRDGFKVAANLADGYTHRDARARKTGAPPP